jgi:hypothetical protein
MRRRHREIVQGQRFNKVGPGGGLWEVVAIKTDAAGATHAIMVSVTEPKTFRTFSNEILIDPRSFQLVE